MTGLIAQTEMISAAAADVGTINSAIDAAKSAAAGPTTGVTAAAADEVSAAVAKMFGTYAQDYQAILKQASVFHKQFVAALAGASKAYAAAEAANAAAISGALGRVTSPIQSLLGGASAAIAAPQALASLDGTTFGLFMGGTGQPIPSQSYVEQALNYVNQRFTVAMTDAQALFTPEGGYPATSTKDLTGAVSVSRGVQILDDAIKSTLAAHPGDSVAVFGQSQSAAISSIEMQNLANPALNPNPPSATQLGFTLIGDPMNPNGGVFERFTPLTLPSLGINFYGATPSNTIYPTNIYTLQYDPFADFPRYPINFLSDLNALIAPVHGTYLNFSPSNLPPGDTLVPLTPSQGYTGVTNYYMIVNSDLPILEPLKSVPLLGTPLYDLLKPDTTMLVNLGYGDPHFGYSTAPPDVATPFGIFPHYNQLTLAQDLFTGAQQGAHAFGADIQAELPLAATSLSPANIAHMLGSATGGFSLPAGLAAALASPDSFIEALKTANTNITNAITNAAADSYATLLPTADIVNALVTSIPSYDANLFLGGIEQMVNGDLLGGLQYALLAPLAANTALYTFVGGFELQIVLGGVTTVVGDLSGVV